MILNGKVNKKFVSLRRNSQLRITNYETAFDVVNYVFFIYSSLVICNS